MPLLRGPEIGLRLGERRLLCDEQSFGAHVQEVRLLDRQDDALEGRVVCPVRREQRFTGRADGARAAAEVEEEPRDGDAGPVGLLLRGTHAARGDPLDGLYRPAERDGGVVLPLGCAICRGRSPSIRPGGARGGVVPQRDVDDVRELELRDPPGQVRRQLRGRRGARGGSLSGRGGRPQHVRGRRRARDAAHARRPAAEQQSRGSDTQGYRQQRP